MCDDVKIRLIPLTQKKFAIVDADDYEYLSQFKWFFHKGGISKTGAFYGYAERKQRIGGKDTAIRMHRVINKTPDGLYTDHVNGNTLDNRKINLRTATSTQNQMNRKSAEGSSSRFKGVHWNKTNKHWQARLKADGKERTIGTFKSEIDAAKAYNEVAEKEFGQYARLNEIPLVNALMEAEK